MQPIPEEVKAAFDQKLAYLKSFKPELEPKGEISRDERGIWRCTYKSQWAEEGVLICMYPDGRCFETHGTIGTKWMYEVGSWIGLPVSDEESDGPDHQVSHFEHGDIRWSKSADKSTVIPKDKLSWYNYRHNELLGYLKEAVEISQPQRHEEALKVIQKKCIEDQFDVVLLGEFADGKSTTLDVLCRGREFSPQGNGVKSTSAVPVSIEAARQELAPKGMSEWAVLTFKGDSQIKDEIYETFEGYLSDSEPGIADCLKPFAKGDGTPKENFREKFDLKNAEHIGFVRQIVGAEWAQYAENKGSIASHHRQQLEVLTIYLKYYGIPEYRALVGTTVVPVSEVTKYVHFPRDWKSRSPSALEFDLSFEECVFVFLDFAVIHVNSEILSRLNCRVTDCPGLGSSAYDTTVARRALNRADGVWFVKKCDKQLGASTLGAIFELITDNGRLERTGMALNLWKGHKKSIEDDPANGKCLVNYCKEQLDKEGYKFPVFWCNARLAYLSAIGKRKMEDKSTFSASERKWMMEIIDEDERDSSWSDEELWLETVKFANLTSKVPEIKNIEKFGQEAVDLLWKHSNMDNALEVMAKIVLDQKGRTILIDSGSKKAFEVIKRYEHELQLAEDNATRDADQVKAELDNARKRMTKFVEEASNIISQSTLWTHKRSMANHLSEDFIGYALNDRFCDDFAKKTAKIIFELNKSFGGVFQSDFKARFAQEVQPKLLDSIQNRFSSFSSSEWKSDSALENVSLFFERVESVNKDLRKLVERLEEDGTLFKELPLPQMSACEIAPTSIAQFSNLLLPVIDKFRKGFWGDLWEIIKWIPKKLIEMVMGSKSEGEVIAELAHKLKPEIAKVLDSKSLTDDFKRGVLPMFNRAIEESNNGFDDGITEFKKTFESRCSELEAANKEKDERKRAIAAENHKVRTEKVQPLREKLEVYEKAVEAEL